MLIRFTVENFLSFKDEVEFSMVAGRGRKHPDHILPRKRKRDTRILKTAVVYGANASGKSNLIKALAFAQGFVLEGTRSNQHIPVTPFLFDTARCSASTRFEFELTIDERIFVYGFELDSKKVHSEWLYESRPASERLLFNRGTNADGQTEIEFGNFELESSHSKEFLTYTALSTRPNQLYLTESIDSNISYFDPVYRWFKDKLVLIFPDSTPHPRFGVDFRDNEEFRRMFRDIIRLFDLAIHDVRLIEIDFAQETRLPSELREQVRQSIRELPRELKGNAIIYIPDLNIVIIVNEDRKLNAYKFETIHSVSNENRQVSFELIEESDGTQRIFELVPALIGLLSDSSGKVYFIDEIDRRLHALTTHGMIDFFLQNSLSKRSQLIVTTHESRLLDPELLRKDEIWFVEKDKHGSSKLFSLEEYALPANLDIERGYLDGRFGAIPILPRYNRLEWADEQNVE